MIELVFVACLVAGEDSCREVSLVYADMPLMTCLLRSQAEMAEWQERHPDAEIRHWTCRAVDREKARL